MNEYIENVLNNINEYKLSWQIGAIFCWISVILIAISIISQTIKTLKSKGNNFGSLITFSIYLFSGLCYLIVSLLFLLFNQQLLTTLLNTYRINYFYWFLAFCLAPITLNFIGSICSTIIVTSITKVMYKNKKTWQECKNDISNWVVSMSKCKQAKGFAKIVLFFRTKCGFTIIISLLFFTLIVVASLFFIQKPNPSSEGLTTEQLTCLLVINGCGAITWTIINWPLFFSTIERNEIANVSLWYILFNTISALTLLVYGIVLMYQVGWAPITIFGCIFNGSGSSFLILYRKIKSLRKKDNQFNV